MSRWVKASSWVGGVLVVVLVAVAAASIWTVRRSFPQTDGTVTLAGLDSSVTVTRDAYGIPQVYADTSADLFFAQGYVQAQDRFFQMDFRRHLTSGRLTELFGAGALETDMFVRTLGWRRVAERELALLSPDTRLYLGSFAQGVNAYLADHQGARLSLEYAVLGLGGLDYTPEEWTPADSLAWLKAMAWDLGGNLEDELERSLDSVSLSRGQIAQLFPAYRTAKNDPIVTQGAVIDGVYEQDAKAGGTRLPSRPGYLARGSATRALRDAQDSTATLSALLGKADGIGSNAWAVSGRHTASGAPILANDPHLAASTPGAWYQMGLHCNQISSACPFDVSGFTFAGLPGVVIGHNNDIAWGFTNLNPDVQDLYLEKVTDDNRYRYNGRLRPLSIREESFSVDGQAEPVVFTVRASQHGPLVSDVSDRYATAGANAPVRGAADDDRPYAVALRWTALEPGRTADALFGIDTATDWQSFREAASDMVAPSQNLVYADVRGHIGYQAPGHVPIRRTGHGDWPVPGWDPAFEWEKRYVPYDALPSVLDPDDGYVVTANQAVTDNTYPYYLGNSFDYGYRAQRIGDLLAADDALTVDDMAAIQLDTYSLLAEQMTPMLRSVTMPSAYYAAGQRLLGGWDFHQDADSAAAAYYNVVLRQLLNLVFADQLPEETMPIGGSRWWAVLVQLLASPRDEFWDDVDTPEVRETRDDILQTALIQARDELTRDRSRDPQEWTWGSLHSLTLRNETLADEDSPVAFLFARGGYRLGGGPSLVNAASWDATEGYQATAVPSMRMIVPLDDLDASRWVNLTGASGHAYDAHYTDQTQLWADGEMLAWVSSPDAVEDAADQTLVLQPSG